MSSLVTLETSKLQITNISQMPLLHVGQGKDMELIQLPRDQIQHFMHLSTSSSVLYLRKFKPEMIHTILKCLPNFEQLILNVENVAQYHEAAEKLGLLKLKEKCESYLKRPRATFDANYADHSKEEDISVKLVALSETLRNNTEYPIQFKTLSPKDLDLLNKFAEGNFNELNELIKDVSDLESFLKGAIELNIPQLLEKCKMYLFFVMTRMSKFSANRFEDNKLWLENFLKYMKICHFYRLSELSNKFTQELRNFLNKKLFVEKEEYKKYLGFLKEKGVTLQAFYSNLCGSPVVQANILETTSGMKTIKKLELGGLELQKKEDEEFLEQVIQPLASILESFTFLENNCIQNELDSLAFLFQCSNLKSLTIKCKNVSDGIWSYLQYLNSLEVLEFAEEGTSELYKFSSENAFTHLTHSNLKMIKIIRFASQEVILQKPWELEILKQIFKS